MTEFTRNLEDLNQKHSILEESVAERLSAEFPQLEYAFSGGEKEDLASGVSQASGDAKIIALLPLNDHPRVRSALEQAFRGITDREGSKVALDLDIAAPHSDLLGEENTEGLSDHFLYGVSPKRILRSSARLPQLKTLSAGTFTPRAAEIYADPGWNRLIGWTASQADGPVVILAPPLERFTDLAALNQADQVLVFTDPLDSETQEQLPDLVQKLTSRSSPQSSLRIIWLSGEEEPEEGEEITPSEEEAGALQEVATEAVATEEAGEQPPAEKESLPGLDELETGIAEPPEIEPGEEKQEEAAVVSEEKPAQETALEEEEEIFLPEELLFLDDDDKQSPKAADDSSVSKEIGGYLDIDQLPGLTDMAEVKETAEGSQPEAEEPVEKAAEAEVAGKTVESISVNAEEIRIEGGIESPAQQEPETGQTGPAQQAEAAGEEDGEKAEEVDTEALYTQADPEDELEMKEEAVEEEPETDKEKDQSALEKMKSFEEALNAPSPEEMEVQLDPDPLSEAAAAEAEPEKEPAESAEPADQAASEEEAGEEAAEEIPAQETAEETMEETPKEEAPEEAPTEEAAEEAAPEEAAEEVPEEGLEELGEEELTVLDEEELEPVEEEGAAEEGAAAEEAGPEEPTAAEEKTEEETPAEEAAGEEEAAAEIEETELEQAGEDVSAPAEEEAEGETAPEPEAAGEEVAEEAAGEEVAEEPAGEEETEPVLEEIAEEGIGEPGEAAAEEEAEGGEEPADEDIDDLLSGAAELEDIGEGITLEEFGEPEAAEAAPGGKRAKKPAKRSRTRSLVTVALLLLLSAGMFIVWKQGTVSSLVRHLPVITAIQGLIPGLGREDEEAALALKARADSIRLAQEQEALLAAARQHEKLAYSIQIGSYRFLTQAMAARNLLRQRGLNDVYVVPLTLDSLGNWNRLYMGMFESSEQADTALLDVGRALRSTAANFQIRGAAIRRHTPLALKIGEASNADSLENLIQRLETNNIPTYMVTLSADTTRAPVYRLYVGAFETEQQAVYMRTRIFNLGVHAEIIQREGTAGKKEG